MRSKEEAHDYRYFPDPDLLPLELSPSLVADLQKSLPELPDGKKSRFMRDYALTAYDADVLVAERETADYFEAVVGGSGGSLRRDPKLAANWVINELAGRLNREGKDIAAAPISAAGLGTILDMIGDGTISGKIAKDVFEIVWTEGGDPRAIVEAARLEAGHRRRGDRKGGRRDRRQEPGQGRRRQDQPESDRLVRRSGHEGVGRQGEPASRQRSSEEENRHLSSERAPRVRRVTARRLSRDENRTSRETRGDTARRLNLVASAESANRICTNSRVLRLARPVNTPSKHAPVHNFFSGREGAASARRRT